jgi:hypothetical protein
MIALFRGFVEKFPFFHGVSTLPSDGDGLPPKVEHFPSNQIYSILMLAMTKRKPAKFSAAKAVKANARERVGQPKPARVIDTEPRTGRELKHKPKLEEILQHEE